ESELLGEEPPRFPVALERLGLSTAPVKREHVLTAQLLSERVFADQDFEFPDQFGMKPHFELGLDALLECQHAQLLEPSGFTLGEGLEGKVGERGAAPKRQGFPKPLRTVAKAHVANLSERALKPLRIELLWFERELIPGGASPQAISPYDLPQPGDVRVQ